MTSPRWWRPVDLCKLLKEEHTAWGLFAQRTAEMQALTEALFWLNNCAEHKGLQSSSKLMITVDSLYVKGLTDDQFVMWQPCCAICGRF